MVSTHPTPLFEGTFIFSTSIYYFFEYFKGGGLQQGPACTQEWQFKGGGGIIISLIL